MCISGFTYNSRSINVRTKEATRKKGKGGLWLTPPDWIAITDRGPKPHTGAKSAQIVA